MTDPLTAAAAADRVEDLTPRQVSGALAIVAGLAALAGPRRTRPVAGFLYGVLLSRTHGASRRRLERELARLFDERQSAHRQIDKINAYLDTVRSTERALGDRVDELGARVDRLERPLPGPPAAVTGLISGVCLTHGHYIGPRCPGCSTAVTP